MGSVLDKTTFYPNSFVRQSAVVTASVLGINSQCVDGGFSWPHRTLGANMLKDQLYGVDFDGAAIAFGVTRGASTADANLFATGYFAAPTSGLTTSNPLPVGSRTATNALNGQAAENLDSVCIDCHGDGSYYNPGTMTEPTNHATGWELLLKGLP